MSIIKPTGTNQPGISTRSCNRGMKKDNYPEIPADSVVLSSNETSDEKEWSVLVYMNGNNTLSEQGMAKLDCQLKEIDKSEQMNIAVHHSVLRSKGWHHPNAINSTRYEVRKNGIKKLDELGPLNMASTDTLVDFVKWGMKKYPAKHYLVVLQSHGGAWHGGLPDDVYKDRMDLPKLDEAFGKIKKETGRKPDVIAFDACLMANTEAAYQLRDHADYMIGSEEVEWGANSKYAEDVSAPYKEIFGNISKKLDSGEEVGPESLAREWVIACDGKWTTPTQSALDLSKMNDLSDSLNKLAGCILDSDTPMETIKEIIRDTKSMHGQKDEKIEKWDEENEYKLHLKDLHEFVEKLSMDPRIKDEKTKKASVDVLGRFDDVVIANVAGSDWDLMSPVRYSESHHIQHHYEGDRNHGLSIFMPDNPQIMNSLEKNEKYPTKYRETAFARENAWGKLVERLTRQE
ncbi:MAG: hypothetical protein K8T10_02590 [Candidatus Eremiobacteraeota bacterium]|nr:hypothetical protein [Candidatus Eremiobacteraeota bacterium]